MFIIILFAVTFSLYVYSDKVPCQQTKLEVDIENLTDFLILPREVNTEKHKEILSDAELTCLVEAVYFEARGEPLEGKLAVLAIIINRKLSGIKKYPDTYCGVVHYTVPKNKNNKAKSCAFS